MARIRLKADICTSVLSGALFACAFPLPGVSWLAWFSLVPLILVMRRRPFLSGYVCGFVFFAVTLYWLNIVMVTYGRLHPLLSVVAYLLLVAYLALFFAVASWLSCRLRERLGYPVAMTLPVVWVALELLRGLLLTGFPWVLTGYALSGQTTLIQSADLFGVYGLSGLIILGNCVLASVVSWFGNRDRRFADVRYAAVFVTLLVGIFAYGTIRLGNGQVPSAADGDVTVALVQGNIDQAIKWSPAYREATVSGYLSLSGRGAADGADLIVWPESATPFYFQEPTPLQKTVIDAVRRSGAYLLTGSPAYERVAGGYRQFNSAFLVTPQGEIAGRSDKVHLVPFGEYVPLGQFLPFIDKLVYGIGDFSPGHVSPLPFGDRKLGVLVCYEAIFPELARAYVRAGSNLLVNVTNDAWFGRSSAPYQHLAMAAFRAVENRRWLVRAANTGITAIVDPFGRVSGQTPLFEKAVLSGQVRMLSGETPYARFGDILPLVFLVISAAWLWQSRLRK